MKTSTFVASTALALVLGFVATACRSDSSSTTTAPAPRDPGTGTVIGEVHDTPNVLGQVTYSSYGGVMVDITVDNTPPAGWEIDSVRGWVNEGTSAPDFARGNPPIASSEMPFSGTPVPPNWSGGAYFEDLDSPIWLLVEVTLRNGATTKKHLHKSTYSASSGLVSVPFNKSIP